MWGEGPSGESTEQNRSTVRIRIDSQPPLGYEPRVWARMPEGDGEMTLRRVLIGLSVVCGVSIWSVCHGGTNPDQAETTDTASVASGEATVGGGNHDEAAYRYRTNQAHHWRHVMIGGH